MLVTFNVEGKLITYEHHNSDDFANMESHYRAKFINSLSGFKSANLIGTLDKDGNTNLAMFSSVVHLGASPALVGFVMRPDNGSRHTLDNIIQTKHYTINQVSADFYKDAHQTSARYSKSESEFEKVNLLTEFIAGILPPFVRASKLKYSVILKEIIPVAQNNTLFIIGEITDVIFNKSAVQSDGYIDLEALKTVSISGLDSYHTAKRLSRLSYAKPERLTREIALSGLSKGS